MVTNEDLLRAWTHGRAMVGLPVGTMIGQGLVPGMTNEFKFGIVAD